MKRKLLLGSSLLLCLTIGSLKPENKLSRLVEAVQHVQYYETYHQFGEFTGYGRKLYSGDKCLSKKQAYDTLFNDILKLRNKFYLNFSGDTALALALLSYNIGYYEVINSKMYRQMKIKNIDKLWLSYHYYNGKPHVKLLYRRYYELALMKGIKLN